MKTNTTTVTLMLCSTLAVALPLRVQAINRSALKKENEKNIVIIEFFVYAEYL